MFCNEHEPLALLVELTPKLAKKRFRQSIYEAWDYKCGYCGDSASSLDHIIPRFKSGSSNRHNLIPCCRRCNANKGSEDMKNGTKNNPFSLPHLLLGLKPGSNSKLFLFLVSVD
jgi:5-methylcytosine-specific restriction endonuclease McrA